MINRLENFNKGYKTGVTFILLRPSGEILMQLRDDGKGRQIPYPDMWCFPGGGKDEGETYLKTTLREVREEYELDIDADSCILLTDFTTKNPVIPVVS